MFHSRAEPRERKYLMRHRLRHKEYRAFRCGQIRQWHDRQIYGYNIEIPRIARQPSQGGEEPCGLRVDALYFGSLSQRSGKRSDRSKRRRISAFKSHHSGEETACLHLDVGERDSLLSRLRKLSLFLTTFQEVCRRFSVRFRQKP